MNITIRRAVEGSDYIQLADLLTAFANEHQLGALSAKEYNPDKAISWIVENVRCATWVAECGGNVIGSLGLRLTSPWYSHKEYYSDGWFYVAPDYRRSHAGTLLLEEAKKFSLEMGKPVVIGLFTMDDPELKIKLLRRKGFKLIGGTFVFGE
jgi:GNAT superfamily N-acetyltransferase